MHIEPSRTGAAAISRRAQRNPLELLVNLIEADPTASVERLWNKWWDTVKGDDDYLKAACRHAFTNQLASLDRDKRKAKPAQKRPAEDVRAQVDAIKQRIVTAVFSLESPMPNGKALGDCTLRELAKFGGIFTRIIKLGKPDQIVRKVVNEAQLKKLAA